MFEVVITLSVLIFTIVTIVTKKIPVIAVGLLIPVILSITGVVAPDTVYSGLASKTTFLIIGALAIGDACFRTGLTNLIGSYIVKYTSKFNNRAVKLLLISLLAAVMSTFLSSFGVQVALMTLIIVMSQTLKISRTQSMIALGYASTVGGTWSIIGTTLMLMAKSSYEAQVPGETIGMFEFTPITLPVGLLVIVLYCFVTSRYLPERCEEKKAVEETQINYSRKNCITVAVIFFSFIILVALDGKTPLAATTVSMLVLLALGAAGISTMKDIINCIAWDVIIFISGITVLSNAIVSSGISDWLGQTLLALLGTQTSPYIILTIVCVFGAFLTQLISNSGAFAIILPFLPVISSSMGISLKALMAASVISCSMGFCLPIAAPSYLILAREGNVLTTDWLKQGILLVIASIAATVILVPIVIPL